MTNQPALMTVVEVARALNLPVRTLYAKPEFLSRLKARSPMGRRKYARVLVERVNNDESLTQLGGRRA